MLAEHSWDAIGERLEEIYARGDADGLEIRREAGQRLDSKACPLSSCSRPSHPPVISPPPSTALNRGLTEGQREQTLLGVTGSGKTFTIANVIAEQQRPTLVLSPNKTLAAQLWAEFREFFPKNAVEYFVSYYDFYQPEAYIPRTDTYIEKDSSRNDEIDRLRNSATRALLTRRDVVVVASISCIYGIGSPENYLGESITVKRGESWRRDILLRKLSDLQYSRNDMDFGRTRFRVRGDVVDVQPAYEEIATRIEFMGDTIEFDQGLRRADRRDPRHARRAHRLSRRRTT